MDEKPFAFHSYNLLCCTQLSHSKIKFHVELAVGEQLTFLSLLSKCFTQKIGHQKCGLNTALVHPKVAHHCKINHEFI